MNFSDEPAGAAEFYEMLGRSVVLWGRFEYSLAHHLTVLQEIHPVAREIILSSRSRGTSSDVAMLVKCFEQIPELQPHTDVATAFQAMVADVSIARNMLAHGHFSRFSSIDPLKAVFSKMQVTSKYLEGSEVEWSGDDLRQIAIDIAQLDIALFKLSAFFSMLAEPRGS